MLLIYKALSRLEDRNGYGVNITYKTFTPAEITASPTRQFQIDTATDANGRIATYSYLPTQVSGKWVISSIIMPNSQTVSYSYSGGYLTGIQHPDGTESEFNYGIDGTTNTTTVEIKDVAADTTHRNKTVYLTNNFSFGGTNYDTSFVSSSSLLVRMVVNGADEVAYLNMFPGTTIIYEGGHQVKKFQNGAMTTFLKKGWTFVPSATSLSAMFPSGTFSHNGGQNVIGSIQQYYRNTPQEYITENGVIIRALYDAEGYIVEKKRYADQAFESYTYNEFKQKTRIRDMEGRVERRTYDSRGNILTKEVGIKEIANVDINQPEYAIYEWEYYPSGHQNQFLQKAFIDANGNRTEYIYNAQQFLTQVIEPADVFGDTQTTLNYSYDSYGRLLSSSDQMGRTTVVEYDQRDRQIKINYNDGSNERVFYGTAGSGNENLITKKVDRNGNVTEFEFDGVGRQTKKTTGHLTMDYSGNQAAVANPLTKVDEICTYLYGTNDIKQTCKLAGELTAYSFDGRNRWVSKTTNPNTSASLTTLRSYTTGTHLRDETDEYGRRTIYAYSGVTSYLYRIIRETVPGNSIDYSALYAVYGQNINNAPYVVTSFSNDLTGLTTQVTDPRGIKQLKTYDSRRRLVEKIEAYTTSDAAKTVTIYDANSNVVEVQHPRNFDATDPEFGKCRTAYTYTARNLLKTKTEGVGSVVQATESFTYTKDRREQTHTDFNGNIWTTIWHICCGRLEAKVDPLGNGTIYDVDYAGNVVHQYSGSNLPLDPTQYVCNNQPITTMNEITTRFDERNRPTHTTQWLQPLGAITNKGRPALGNGQIPIAGEDGVPASHGLTTCFVYDDNLTDNIGLDVIYSTYLVGLNLGANSDGSAVEITNPNGEVVVMIKDGLGRVIKTIDGSGDETQTQYDQMVGGLLETTQIVDPAGLNIVTRSQVDGIGRVQKSIDAENNIAIVEYDNNRNAVKTRDANGVGLDCVFDNRNRDTQCTDTKGDKTTKTYNKNSNITQSKDALNKITTMVFDARNRLKSTTNRISGTVTQTYDANSNLLTITDAQNNSTQYLYDVRNLQTQRIFADSEDATDKIVFTYDALQRKTSQTDQAGVTISYQFDMANRLMQRNYPDNLNDVFQYDNASRLTQAVSIRYQNTVTRSYNSDGTMATEGLSTNGESYQISHLYDNAKRSNLTTYPNGKVIGKAFTNRNQLSSIAYDGNLMANFQYDAGRREISRGLGNGLTQITNYNLDNTINQKSVAGITNFSYTYDGNKRKTSETDGTMSSLSQTFSYDFEDRLTSWSSNGTTLNQTQSWNLSLEGAWSSTTVNGNTETRTFNQTYETLFSNSNPMSHDRKGNLTQNKDGSLFTWDFDNQLAFSTAGTPSVNAAYAYDALGRRVSKSSGNTITVFVHSNYQIATEYKSINGGAFTEHQSFVYASYIDDPIALISTNGTYFYHSNQQYSISAITDSNGNLSERYGYNAYGKLVVITDSILVDNPYFFTGRQLDSETGLFYFRARYYDASLGQFISRDPIGFVDGMNLYRGYFAPKSLDPFGREDMPPAEIPKEEFHIEDLPKEVPEPPKESQPPSSEDLWPKDWDEARRQRERKKREREKREREKREREKREGPGGPGFNFNLDFTYITTTQDSDMVIEIQEMVTVVTRATNDPCE